MSLVAAAPARIGASPYTVTATNSSCLLRNEHIAHTPPVVGMDGGLHLLLAQPPEILNLLQAHVHNDAFLVPRVPLLDTCGNVLRVLYVLFTCMGGVRGGLE